MINKETHKFKFNGLNWKLIAKIENESQDLLIFLKNIIDEKENSEINFGNKGEMIKLNIDNSVVFSNNKNQMNSEEICSFYYQLSYGNEKITPLTLKSINNNRENELLISKIENKIWTSYNNKEINFTVYLNTEHMYSSILMYITDNLMKVLELEDIANLNKEEILVVLKKLPKKSENQEFGLILALKWGNKKLIKNLV